MRLIRYESHCFGTWVFLPIYSESSFILEVTAKACGSKKKQKEIDLSLDMETPLDLELLANSDCDHVSGPAIDGDKGYVFSLRTSEDFYAKIRFQLSGKLQEGDLEEDMHIGKIVRSRSSALTNESCPSYENAYNIYQYVLGIPFSKELPYYMPKPNTPAQTIRSNIAKKCVCKAELFKDLCIASGIPSRAVSAEYYSDTDISRYELQRNKPKKNHSHQLCAFYEGTWHLADPTLGGFGENFQSRNYYDRVVSARGVESIDVRVMVE
ncbi:MAG: transglutaminase domain-containing protein [Nanoarchaeota archaeon]|nr:transglutaminase domain-containing protein [Nanoarchaeota archaeon]